VVWRFFVFLSLFAVVGLGTFFWRTRLHHPELSPAQPAQIVDRQQEIRPPARREFSLPEEPTPPARGTETRQAYFAAVVHGEERGLANVRAALANARTGPGRGDSSYETKLLSLQREYEARLARHRRELAPEAKAEQRTP